MTETTAVRIRFAPREATAVRYTGTNNAEIADAFGLDWIESLAGHPLAIGSWLYRLDGRREVFVASSRILDAHTEPVEEASDV